MSLSAPQINTNLVIKHKKVELSSGANVFYLEAGDSSKPNLLLLHGLPSSSRQYKDLIILLAPYFHIVAPDLPGYGQTTVADDFVFSFAGFADTIDLFLDTINFDNFALYIFDYGAPTGLRIAIRKTKTIKAIITQNGNAYLEGIQSDFWTNFKKAWSILDTKHKTEEQEKQFKELLISFKQFLSTTPGYTFQYEDGEPDSTLVDPEAGLVDFYLLTNLPNSVDHQVEILLDYRTNLDLYPEFQKFFKETQIPILAVWGKNDQIFTVEGAHAYKKDSKNVKVVEIDAGHFAVSSHTVAIAQNILDFFAEYNLLG
ncbi:predicted protein [Scheffersomyces stipitis CBS 6054]|uniref:AB hydrolase-1 domain-containing protein n=1 Tax=Scheffersomyces stipitis (strain ATCC 58785 / CBS 6054 / NBRC 10063 / NRRL Y-11545) TaxID=322104 RepID=A3GHX1_PICST|nr:predicted protein [Scheffersomyces stipitis CBS 6054]EAZ62891.2 predicted protein [Scheffersomyces stipitis CBS 6054]KAG2735517.1 hypothetical protein G9P44_001731 [Scheffersomyces stipitis]